MDRVMIYYNKVALVTGAGSGIGRATALAFAREGAKVLVADITVPGGEETVALIKQAGGEAVFAHTDVSRAVDPGMRYGSGLSVWPPHAA